VRCVGYGDRPAATDDGCGDEDAHEEDQDRDQEAELKCRAREGRRCET
jgi:hypothetical protein